MSVQRACLTMVNVSTPSVYLSVCIPSRWWKLNKAPQSGYAKRVHTLASRTFSVIETCRDLRRRHATSFRFVFLSTIKMWQVFFFFYRENMFPKFAILRLLSHASIIDKYSLRNFLENKNNLQMRLMLAYCYETFFFCNMFWIILNLRFNHPHSIYEIV